MRIAEKISTLVLVLMVASGCSDGNDDDGAFVGPYDQLTVDETLSIPGLSQPVDVVRDQYGTAHVNAQNMADLGVALGYTQAEDRLQQMDLFRRFASGTVSELFGALQPEQIDADLSIRMHRMRPLAAQAWDDLQASSDPDDVDLVALLDGFARGVNFYLDDLQAGKRAIDPALLTFFDPARTPNWSPVDTLAIARLQSHLLSYDEGDELWASELIELSRLTFDQSDPALARRMGAEVDLYPLAPQDATATVEGFPDGRLHARAPDSQHVGARPRVSPDVLARARGTVAPKTELARRLLDRRNGSNSWVVGPQHTDGSAIMSNDPHLTMSSPSFLYLSHVTVPGSLDVAGVGFAGIPGIVIGHNQHVAWGATTVNHDVTDYYLEEVVPCLSGPGDCVMFEGQEVAIESWEETIQIGALGTIIDTLTVTYERIPHHGPIIPTIADHDIVPRASGSAVSLRYTGHDVSFESRALMKLWRAGDVQEAITALEHFWFGGQNWVFVDSGGAIGWTSHARVPLRSPGCFTYHATDMPDGLAPFLLLPADGSCEWEGWMDPRYIPNAIEPESGYLITANQDPIGITFDGDPLNGPMVEGRPLYLGAMYNEGYRQGRITRRIQDQIASGEPMSMETMMGIQADAASNLGDRMRPHILAATARMEQEIANPGTHVEIGDWLAGLSPMRVQALTDAAARIQAWTLNTPPAVQDDVTADEIADSVATSIFNGWAVVFFESVVGDELAAMDVPFQNRNIRGVVAMLERPESLQTGLAPETGEPVLCDDLETSESIESCTILILRALDGAISWAQSAEGFDTQDMNDWRWGRKHTLTLAPLVPVPELAIPAPDDPDPALRNGYPRHGDNYSVDASSPGFTDFDFRYTHGPSMRHIVSFSADGQLNRKIAIPGGVSGHRETGHFRDLMDAYWSQNEYFEPPWTVEQIAASAERYWRFEPGE